MGNLVLYKCGKIWFNNKPTKLDKIKEGVLVGYSYYNNIRVAIISEMEDFDIYNYFIVDEENIIKDKDLYPEELPNNFDKVFMQKPEPDN
jgi:hypothetical protein